jgi:hypothetical protein
MDKGGTGYSYMMAEDFPSDITVLEVSSEVQNPDFTKAGTDQGIYNHHTLVADMVDPGAVWGCEEGVSPGLMGLMSQTNPFSVFAAGATEDGKIQFYSPTPNREVNSGYYIKKDRNVINSLDVINYNNEERSKYQSPIQVFISNQAPTQSSTHRWKWNICLENPQVIFKCISNVLIPGFVEGHLVHISILPKARPGFP